mmetsp:Transcript_17524/g.44676  ORF Transcript_17524/g.44676 Transcript_17524/m.44676 type:complete len:128 (+) Transcript_17524:603-986(+)
MLTFPWKTGLSPPSDPCVMLKVTSASPASSTKRRRGVLMGCGASIAISMTGTRSTRRRGGGLVLREASSCNDTSSAKRGAMVQGFAQRGLGADEFPCVAWAGEKVLRCMPCQWLHAARCRAGWRSKG